MKQQRGFTLLELMVAMAIFAMLAVAGWQVFDSVNRARERAQYHADQLAVLQYAYLQLQQDTGQIIAYQAPSSQNANNTINAPNLNNSNVNNNNNANSNQDNPTAEPFMSLDSEQVSFIRFADPDPRYQSSPSLQRVDYIFADQRLIRRQYTSIQNGPDSISLDTVLLDGITAGSWQAYLPAMSSKFPDANKQDNNSRANVDDESEVMLLPKGVSLSFTYQDMPITWQFALAPQPLPNKSNSDDSNIDGNANTNGNGNNTGGDDNNRNSL